MAILFGMSEGMKMFLSSVGGNERSGFVELLVIVVIFCDNS